MVLLQEDRVSTKLSNQLLRITSTNFNGLQSVSSSSRCDLPRIPVMGPGDEGAGLVAPEVPPPE